MVDQSTDAELLRRTEFDPDSFAVFVSRYVGAVHGWFARRTRDHQATADLTSETFAIALAQSRRFRDEAAGSAAPWLFGIVHNLMSEYARQLRVSGRARRRLGWTMPATAAADWDEVEERIAAEQLRDAVFAALRTLPGEQRDAVRLRIIDELPYDDVAHRLGCSDAAARIRVSRGLKRLRLRLEGEQLW